MAHGDIFANAVIHYLYSIHSSRNFDGKFGRFPHKTFSAGDEPFGAYYDLSSFAVSFPLIGTIEYP
jgi:hypothetical protein